MTTDTLSTLILILFLDFYKAFDSLEHTFMIETLKSMGFGQTFCNIIKMVYTDISSAISLNPGMTSRFAVSGGIHQGCPILPKLFILATHMLSLLIKNYPNLYGINVFDKVFEISQLADDSAIFFRDKFDLWFL